MERKIGEIFEHNGEWYQCVESPDRCTCNDCDAKIPFNPICPLGFGECRSNFRDDHKMVQFKKLEPVGGPYPLYGHIVQRHTGVTPPVVLPQEPYAQYNPINNTVDIEVKQEPQNTEHMETNTHKTSTDPIRPISPISPTPPTKPTAPATPTKTIPIPDGYEFDRIDDNGNILLKEKKPQLPDTWEKCLRTVNETEYINEVCKIETANVTNMEAGGYRFYHWGHNLLPSGLGKPMLALYQLLICRNAWWKQLGWKPDWANGFYEKFFIGNYRGIIDKECAKTWSKILAFPTAEVRDQFLDTFRDLIEEAKELL